MRRLLSLLMQFLLVAPALAGTSANYTLDPAALDHGGQRGTTTNYTLNASAMPGGHGTSTDYTLRTGFAGQLADAIAAAIELSATPLTVDEGGTRQLFATLLFDDLSTQPLAASSLTWSVQSGPLVGISTSGLATASAVFQDSVATVQGTYQSLTDTLTLTVLNTQADNFGSYAADGIDDDWQVEFFGLENPLAAPGQDPDFDGQINLFEFIAGLNPLDHESYFVTTITGNASQVNITFSPRFLDRAYVVKTSTTLLPSDWTTLSAPITNDVGQQRTLTDTNVSGSRKFYRVEISRP